MKENINGLFSVVSCLLTLMVTFTVDLNKKSTQHFAILLALHSTSTCRLFGISMKILFSSTQVVYWQYFFEFGLFHQWHILEKTKLERFTELLCKRFYISFVWSFTAHIFVLRYFPLDEQKRLYRRIHWTLSPKD